MVRHPRPDYLGRKDANVTQNSDPEVAQMIWQAGVDAVSGDASVSLALSALSTRPPDQIIAVGKAASAMTQAAIRHFRYSGPALVVTKYGHGSGLPAPARVIEAAHPVPDENSLLAGRALVRAVRDMKPDGHLLVLVSGGASSLAELPREGLTLKDLADENNRMLAAGLDIHAMNAHRKTLSQIKGGQLLGQFRGASVTVLAISDVQGDDLSVIGSGIGSAPDGAAYDFDAHIVASNSVARAAATDRARTLGLTVLDNAETLYGNVSDLAPTIGQHLRASRRGVHILGGEPTVVLPENPGQGGRNQALALMLAREISGTSGLTVLVAGTDGSDGPTNAAGAIINGTTWTQSAQRAIREADSGRWLDQRDAVLRTGPTGTNVMDLLVAVRT